MKTRMTILTTLMLIILVSLSGCAVQSPLDVAMGEVALKNHSALAAGTQKAKWAQSWWMDRHDAINKRIAQGNVDLIMVGDSITHGWERQKELWDKYYAPRNAVNMGYGGDRTQHILWHLENGNIDGIDPKLAVVMIGTNNSNRSDNTAEEIADGIIAICGKLRQELVETKILVLAIFPRNAKPGAQRAKNELASKLASRIADGEMVHYLDINSEFLTSDGTLSKDIMPDLLHPNKKGYEIWAAAMEGKIVELMGE